MPQYSKDNACNDSITCKKIALVSFNARYEHTSLGLRCIMANMEELEKHCILKEFTLDASPESVLEDILIENPIIIGLGVYIWNVEICLKFAKELKSLRPEITLICGGPEISHTDRNVPDLSYAGQLAILCDYVICGEGENAFRELCRKIISGVLPAEKFINASPTNTDETKTPYHLYSDEDIENRLVYIEASRGCPFGCEFCLSSLDKKVRFFPLEKLFTNLKYLLARGLLTFKFTDRSFNIDTARARKILEFFLENYKTGIFLHFEIVPDIFPEELLPILAKFPKGSIQLEAGIQTFNPEVAARISRRQDNEQAERNMRRIISETGCYIHADLIAGLPGETLENFAAGFDRLYGIGPHEIQVGILKLLKGAPIARHTEKWGMKYSPLPPYEVRETSAITFKDMRRLRRFSRFWDLVSNSGTFVQAAQIICRGYGDNVQYSPFYSFMAFADALYKETHQTHSISRARLRNFIMEWLTDKIKIPEKEASRIMEQDAVNARKTSKRHSRQERNAAK